MDVMLVTEGTYPHAHGGVSVWCDQMIRGLTGHRFHLVALSATGREPAVFDLPRNVASFHTVPVWADQHAAARHSPRLRSVRRCVAAIDMLEAVFSHDRAAADSFEAALYELSFLARSGDLADTLHTDAVAVALAELWSGYHNYSAPALPLADAMTALNLIEHALRPLSFAPPAAQVVHAVSNGLAVLVGLAAKWNHGTPLVLAEHGVYLRERYLALRNERLSWPVKSIIAAFTRRLCEAGYRAADLITPCNEYNQRWERRLGADPAKLRTVYNGIDPRRFHPSDAEPDTPTVVFVGRIDPLKDVITLIRSFAIVRERLPDARLRIFGTAPKGGETYLQECVDLVAKLRLEESVVFEGQCSDTRQAYVAGQIVVLSSISEGLPFTVLEAMACGRPNVGTEVGGVGEAIGDTGLIVPPRRPAELAQACLELLTDHERRRTLGAAARRRALELFTIEHAVAAFDTIYRDLALAPAASAAPVGVAA